MRIGRRKLFKEIIQICSKIMHGSIWIFSKTCTRCFVKFGLSVKSSYFFFFELDSGSNDCREELPAIPILTDLWYFDILIMVVHFRLNKIGKPYRYSNVNNVIYEYTWAWVSSTCTSALFKYQNLRLGESTTFLLHSLRRLMI